MLMSSAVDSPAGALVVLFAAIRSESVPSCTTCRKPQPRLPAVVCSAAVGSRPTRTKSILWIAPLSALIAAMPALVDWGRWTGAVPARSTIVGLPGLGEDRVLPFRYDVRPLESAVASKLTSLLTLLAAL